MVNWTDTPTPVGRQFEIVTEVEPVKHIVAAHVSVIDGALVVEDEHGELLLAVAPLFWTSVRRVR